MAIAAPSPLLTGQRTVLRPVEEGDASFILKQRLDPRIGAHLHATSPDLSSQQLWIRQQRERPDDYYFAICLRGTGEMRGVIGLYNVTAQEAELGRYICIGAPEQAMEGSLLLQHWALETLGLNVVYCTFTPANRTTRVLTRVQQWYRHPEPVTDALTGTLLERWQTDQQTFRANRPRLLQRLEALREAAGPTR
ncbi:GNAT family N-acetyltransferase [Deinococcus multiflagellatus]|uniref:GNAT family N-acetyltransferase n=1 Tax=Deinococcus multiflagellatus TaxID=1656887 RepID=A0ABW1ZJG2_9DEIO|nr:GNAT family N-acetyltransferase [Deinococcus multiflagellatus]MBZ9713227.1 GNAT family N-acetyltransferase [Deinococcus multiflagellatus]